MRKLLSLVFAAALCLTPLGAYAQFAQQATWGGAAGGTANALTLTIPNATALSNLRGVVLTFVPSATNTSATSLNVNSLGAQPVKKSTSSGLAALTGGEFVSGDPAQVYWDGAEFVIVGPVSAAGSGGGSTENCNGNKFLYSYKAYGAYSFVVPAGCVWIKVKVVGAGGASYDGGGGQFSITVNNNDGSIGSWSESLTPSGGGAGGTSIAWLSETPGGVINFTVGQGGPAGNGSAQAPNGGTSSFGYLTGYGGQAAQLYPPNSQISPGSGGSATGGQANYPGGAGSPGGPNFGTTNFFGLGGASSLGGPGAPGSGGTGTVGSTPPASSSGYDGAVIISD